MNIRGWIRQGDVAACGASVIEGVQTCSSYGRAYTYQGASIACSKRCVIAEGLPTNVLPNGRPRVLHGMRSSQGCPLISTLNGTDGISSESTIFPAFVPDGEGEWRGIVPPDASHEKEFDEYFIVLEQETGKPARRRFYRITLDTGEIIEGYTDEQGRTTYAQADRRQALRLELGPQREIEVGK